eukprot:2822469-Prymnesium_polylepis.1
MCFHTGRPPYASTTLLTHSGPADAPPPAYPYTFCRSLGTQTAPPRTRSVPSTRQLRCHTLKGACGLCVKL